MTGFTLSGERVRFGQNDIHTLRLLGVQPELGRWYRDDDVIVGETAQAIVISHGLWQRRFGGDPGIIGQRLPDWTAGWGEVVIGVMPPGFCDRYRVIHNLANHYEVLPAADELFSGILERLEAIPGVESVGLTSMLPPNIGASFPVTVIGHPEVEDAFAPYQEVSPAFFDTMRIPLARGRFFTDLDRANAPSVVIINEAAAREWFPGEEPIGQTIQIPYNQGNPELEQTPPRQIVGIVEDSRLRLQDDPAPVVYTPYLQHVYHYAGTGPGYPNYHKEFVIRAATGGTTDLAAAVNAAVDEVDPVVALDQMIPMRARLSQSAANEQFLMRLLGTFAVLGVFLAAMGIYGVISYSVVQRRQEFGIRAAMGAPRFGILWLVIREALVVTGIGTGVGILGAFALTRLIQNQLYEVTPMDPLTITAVALVLFAVAVIASWVPGRHASRQSPLIALRVD